MAKSVGGVRGSGVSQTQNKAIQENAQKGVEYTDLQSFADAVIEDGYNRGRTYEVSDLDPSVMSYLSEIGIMPESNKILISDDVIREYLTHPKNEKGAAIDRTRYNELEKMMKSPEHIYVDTKQKNLILVHTTKDSAYSKGKLLKAVVHINFKNKGQTFNKLKSIGVVSDSDMRDNSQYKKIK